jgi:hypothetical protein
VTVSVVSNADQLPIKSLPVALIFTTIPVSWEISRRYFPSFPGVPSICETILVPIFNPLQDRICPASPNLHMKIAFF